MSSANSTAADFEPLYITTSSLFLRDIEILVFFDSQSPTGMNNR